MKVSDKSETGTTFSVCRPRTEGGVAAKGGSDTPIPRGTERILFVDDEEGLADLGRRMLQHLGYTVTVKAGGDEALDLFKAQPEGFDLVITDYAMPGMTGADLAREVMRIRPDIPVVLCTGLTERLTKAAVRGMHIRAYLLKPFDLRCMAEAVRKVLEE